VEFVSQGLRNCTNLRSCTWTRDGSLTSDILLALANPFPPPNGTLSSHSTSIHALRELEINGHHARFYDPKLLLQFKWLEKISLIMPTVKVIQVLEEWVEVVRDSLRSLNIICKVRLRPSFELYDAECLTDLYCFNRCALDSYGAPPQKSRVLSYDWVSSSLAYRDTCDSR
jgi:hypothetical protein